MFCLTCLWNIYISCCRWCCHHCMSLSSVWLLLICRNEIHTISKGMHVDVYLNIIIISTGQEKFLFLYYFLQCIKIAGEAHKMQKYTHLFAFSIPNKSFSTTDCFRHINVPRSDLYTNANWMRKQWLKIKLPYLCATATAAAHFVLYCWCKQTNE